jgi:hypothetical protein
MAAKKKAAKVKVAKGEKKIDVPEGALQSFKNSKGKSVQIYQVIGSKDCWETNGRIKRTMVSHDGVKKIADEAGISKDVHYEVLTQPSAVNNYQYSILARVKRITHLPGEENQATEIGEANRNNLGSRGRNNPANMAQKRAYDRAVFRLLGITGLLSEEEIADEENNEPEKMHNLTPEESKKIAPLINQLLLAKTEKDLVQFSVLMKEKKVDYNDNQLNYLRELYKKRLAEMKKVNF